MGATDDGEGGGNRRRVEQGKRYIPRGICEDTGVQEEKRKDGIGIGENTQSYGRERENTRAGEDIWCRHAWGNYTTIEVEWSKRAQRKKKRNS